MTNEQITALAREYAESRYPEAKTYEDEYLRNTAAYVMEDKLKWLSQRYCLVDKETVRKAFWQLTDKLLSDGDNKSFGTVAVVLESLFPDIAKEVEG